MTPAWIARLSAAGYFVVYWLALLVVLRSQPLNDPGSLWHIRVGEIVLDSGIPTTDPFTWQYADVPWRPQQWGAEVPMALAHRVAGFDTLLMLMHALLASFAAWVTVRFTRGGLHPLPAIGLTAFGLAAAAFHFYLRPHLATIVLSGLLAGLLVSADRGRCGLRRLWYLVPLTVVWTNLHGGVLGGLLTAGVTFAGWLLIAPQQAGFRRDRWLVWAALILGTACLATLVNPYGYGMHRIWFGIVGSDIMKQVITEHMPLNPDQTDGKAILLFGAFYAAILLGSLPKRPRITWLLPPMWFVLSLTSIRHGPIFCAVALAVLPDLLPQTVWFRLLKKYGDTLIRDRQVGPFPRGLWVLPTLLVLVSLGIQAKGIRVPLVGIDWARLDPKFVPVEMIAPLREYAASRPPGQPIFNDANLGGFLIYFAPTLKIFMDDRCELCLDAGMIDYVDLTQTHPERFDSWAEKGRFDRALLTPDTKLEEWLLRAGSGWREVSRCGRAVLFARE